MQRFFIMPCLLVLAACASAGVKVDQAKLSQLHKGKSTYNEVIETLGQPTQTMVADNGDKTASNHLARTPKVALNAAPKVTGRDIS